MQFTTLSPRNRGFTPDPHSGRLHYLFRASALLRGVSNSRSMLFKSKTALSPRQRVSSRPAALRLARPGLRGRIDAACKIVYIIVDSVERPAAEGRALRGSRFLAASGGGADPARRGAWSSFRSRSSYAATRCFCKGARAPGFWRGYGRFARCLTRGARALPFCTRRRFRPRGIYLPMSSGACRRARSLWQSGFRCPAAFGQLAPTCASGTRSQAHIAPIPARFPRFCPRATPDIFIKKREFHV